jgi:hypothetical protein
MKNKLTEKLTRYYRTKKENLSPEQQRTLRKVILKRLIAHHK